MQRLFILLSCLSFLFCVPKMKETDKPNGGCGPDLCHGYFAQEGTGIFVYLGLIAQQARLTGTTYAHITDQDPTELPNTGRLLRPQFKVNVGFNGGFGYRYFHDNWSINLDFSYLESRLKDSCGECADLCDYVYYAPDCIWCHDLFDIDEHIDPTDSELAPKVCFTIDYYDLNLILERASFVSGCLSVAPGFGIKNTWIQYDDKIDYCDVYGYFNCCATETGLSYVTHNIRKCEHIDFYGIGPLITLDGKWYVGECFAFFSDFDAALLVGRFKTCDTVSVDNILKTSMTDSGSIMSPYLGLNIGVEYRASFRNNTLHSNVKLGYDNSIYFNQYQRICYTGICSLKVHQSNTYALTGLKFSVGLDF